MQSTVCILCIGRNFKFEIRVGTIILYRSEIQVLYSLLSESVPGTIPEKLAVSMVIEWDDIIYGRLDPLSSARSLRAPHGMGAP